MLGFLQLIDQLMDRSLRIIYWVGAVAIWVVAAFWLIFGAILYNQNSDQTALYIAGGAIILGLFFHFIWRYICSNNTGSVDDLISMVCKPGPLFLAWSALRNWRVGLRQMPPFT